LLLRWVHGWGGGPLAGGWSGFRVWLLRWWVVGRAGLGGGQGDRTVPVAVSNVRLGGWWEVGGEVLVAELGDYGCQLG